MNLTRPTVASISAVLASLVSPASAQHAGDVVLTIEANRVVTGVSAPGGPPVPQRVFAAVLGELSPSLPDLTDEPGFNSIPGQFPPGQPVGLTIRRAARIWTPHPALPGEGEFCAIPEEGIEVRKDADAVLTPPADPAPAPGPWIEIGFSDPADGLLHEHALFTLTGPADPGIYLLELEVWVGSPSPIPGGVEPSRPFWILFGKDHDDAALDEVADWLTDSLAANPDGPLCPSSCPCDWNRQGGATVQDVFDFLAAYFAGGGDFNDDGATTVQDIFDFLACYFTGCP